MAKRIAFDLRPLQIGHQNRGIGMVIKHIIENLDDKTNYYIFYCFDSSNPVKDLGIKVPVEYEIVTTRYTEAAIHKLADIPTAMASIYHKFKPLKARRIDTFVQFDHNLGIPRFANTKTVLFAYDLIPLIFRNKYLPGARFAFSNTIGTKKTRLVASIRARYHSRRAHITYKNYRKCDRIVAISETVKQSFVDILKIDKKSITVAQLAPASEKTGFDDSILDKLAIKNTPYITYIGGTDSRKHVEDVVHAFNITNGRGSDLKLVLAGNEFKKLEHIPDVDARNAIMQSPYKDKILLAGYVSDSEKNSLYKYAHAFVLASLYEGFGLPVIEAQAKSCPVIAYDNSAISETAKDTALLVESGNYTKLAEAIGALFNSSLREKIIDKGQKNSLLYSWNSTVSVLKKLY